MKKGKTKSFTKLKLIEKNKYLKPTSTTNINSLNNNNDISNNKQRELLKNRGKYITSHEHTKSNISNQKLKLQKIKNLNKDNSIENETIKHSKRKIGTFENQILQSDNNNKNKTEELNNNINKNKKINNINYKNNNILNNEKVLLKIQKLQEKYEKKLSKDNKEIKNLLERNDKLEELVLKLKETLDRANEMFPDFLEQLINTKEEKERESNRTALSYIDKKNEEEKLKEKINFFKIQIINYEKEN